MEAIKSVKYHPVPAVRGTKTSGMQKLYTKIINKIEDLPPKLHTKLQPKPTCNLVRSAPVNKPVTKVRKPVSPTDKKTQNSFEIISDSILSDDDEFYSKLTFDEAEQSLEDEIFEELEKVAHDEVKLNAALQNFDRILLEYNDKKARELKAAETKREEKPSSIPKPLQKSKTCSIIESKCILKKQDEKKKNVPPKVEKPLNVDNFGSITSANYYQVTKSLWNLQDFDEFAKSSPKQQLGQRKSDGATPTNRSALPRAKSVWDIATAPRPTYSRQSSISKIPIKSSKLSTSMMQLNASSTALNTSYCSPSPRLIKSSVYASTMSLTSPAPSKLSALRRSSLGLTSKKLDLPPSKSIGKYAETKASLQRRNMMSSTNSINRSSISMAPGRTLKSAKSELSIHGRFALPPQGKQKLSTMPVKAKCDVLLDKCLVKGHELLRKAEELNDANHPKSDARKRDYIAKQQPASLPTKPSPAVIAQTKTSSANFNSIKSHRNETLPIENAITNRSTVDNPTGNHHRQRHIESEMPVVEVESRTTVTIKTVDVAPTLESCEIIPVVLEAATRTESIGDAKDYSSDCSDDSGHISNENEDLTMKMDVKKPRKISEELLEIFEKKAQQKITPTKAKVIELNHVNLVKTSMEIYPTLNKTCKSEVTFFISKY